jgi:hypothetical protein
MTDKDRRITNIIKYLKDADCIAFITFILIASEFIYFVDNLNSQYKYNYTYYNRIKKSIKINQLNLIKIK